MNDWYYVEKGERQGPVDRHSLVSKLGHGELPHDALVWQDGMADWVPAESMPELASPASGIADAGMEASIPGAVASRGVGNALARGQSSGEPGGYDPFAGEHHGIVSITYAGFWKRFVAYVIDSLILQGVSFAIQIVMSVMLAIPGLSDNEAAVVIVALITFVGYTIGYLVYFAAFESRGWQGTPGKKVLGIKVVDTEGNPVTFWRAMGRNVGKILSGALLLIGYIMAGFTEQKQALHDMMAGCLVVNA